MDQQPEKPGVKKLRYAFLVVASVFAVTVLFAVQFLLATAFGLGMDTSWHVLLSTLPVYALLVPVFMLWLNDLRAAKPIHLLGQELHFHETTLRYGDESTKLTGQLVSRSNKLKFYFVFSLILLGVPTVALIQGKPVMTCHGDASQNPAHDPSCHLWFESGPAS